MTAFSYNNIAGGSAKTNDENPAAHFPRKPSTIRYQKKIPISEKTSTVARALCTEGPKIKKEIASQM
jgi:hypothetical protein